MQRRDFGWFHPLGRLNSRRAGRWDARDRRWLHGDDWPDADWRRTRRGQYRSRCHHDDRRRGRIWVGQRRHLGQLGIGRSGKRDRDGHGRSGRQRKPSGRLRAVGGSVPAPHGQRVPQLAPRPASRSRDDRRAGARFVVDRRLRQRQRRDRVDLRGRRRAVSDRDRRRDHRRRLPTAPGGASCWAAPRRARPTWPASSPS